MGKSQDRKSSGGESDGPNRKSEIGKDPTEKVEIDLSKVPSAQIWDDLPKNFRNKKKVTYIRNHSDLKMASSWTKFYLLMWKNWLTLKRRWVFTLIETLTPVLAIAILAIYVSSWPENNVGDNHVRFRSFLLKTSNVFFKECERFVFVPNIKLISDVADLVKKELPREIDNKTVRIELLGSVKELEELKNHTDLCAAVVFHFKHSDLLTPMEYFPPLINYSIRLAAVNHAKDRSAGAGGFLTRGAQWDTSHSHPSQLVTGPRNFEDETGGSPGYYRQGFLYLQNLVAEKVIEKIYIGGHSQYASQRDARKSYEMLMENIEIRLQRFPYPAIKDNEVVRMIHDVLPLVIVISYLIPIMLMVWNSVSEKQSGIRIQMKRAGISLNIHRYSWGLRCLLLHTPCVASVTAILATNWSVKSTGIFTQTNPFAFFLMMMAYVWQTICTSILFVTFFRRASTAAVTAGLLWFASYAPYYYVKQNYNDFSFYQRLFASTLGNTAISLGCHLVAEGEATGNEVTWNNLFSWRDKETYYPNFTVGIVITVLVIMGFIQIGVSRYIARVWPEPGITPMPWNFCLKVWFWQHKLPLDEEPLSHLLLNSLSLEERFPENFEPEIHVRRRKELQIEKITKYSGGERILNKINLNCYENYLTVLIGDEASGTSALLGIICGMIPWTKGNIIMSRHDMSKNVSLARTFCGYCPKVDVLYPCMTVQETLLFYVQMKCIQTRLEAWDEVERFLSEAMLLEYRDNLVSELTIGAKRILMVACAFIGGSRVVLLDDPATHMSAGQKRMLWEFVGKQKKHRTVLVAMEALNEAEPHVDRMVVMQNGEINCVGSPRFFQQKFGGGNHLIIEKKEGCREEMIIDLVSRRVKDSTLEKKDNKLDFFLPEENSEAFPGLFEELEKKGKLLGVKEVKNSFITMEEVLLNIKRIAMETDYDPENRKAIYQGADEIHIDENYERVKGFKHWVFVFKLLFLKNARFSLRRRTLFLTETLFPVICVLIAATILYMEPFEGSPSPLNMSLTPYKNKAVLVDCYESSNEGNFLCKHLRKVLRSFYNTTDIVELKRKQVRNVILDMYNNGTKESDIPVVAIEVNSNPYAESSVEMTGYFNNQPLHVSPLVLNIMDNAILDYMVGALGALYPQLITERGGYLNHSIFVSNHPLPYTAEDQIKFAGIFISSGFFLGIVMAFAFSFLVASFVILHVQEKEFKHLQMIAGANSFLFWGANYLWNFLHFSFVAVLVVLLLYAFNSPGFDDKGDNQALWLFIFLECYALCIVFFTGAWSIIPVSHWGLAFSRIFLFLLLTGPLFMLLIVVMSDPTAHSALGTIANFHNFFLFFPNYALGMGVFYIVANSVHQENCALVENFESFEKSCKKIDLNPWTEFSANSDGAIDGGIFSCCYHWKKNPFDFLAYGVGRNMTCMLFVLIVSLVIRVLKESAVWTKMIIRWTRFAMRRWIWFENFEHEIYDYDVLNEALKVFHGEVADGLILNDLTKEIPGSRKVNSITVDVDRGECFCLLGVKGAGKSHTLKMMAGTMLPTGGDVTIHGDSLKRNYVKYIKRLGYCPDMNPFLLELTGRETLELIGTLRKIPHETLDGLITNTSLRLLFLHDLENQIKNYNGISARKLAAAVAMLGSPEVILFDEPTNCIDLLSREYLHKSIHTLMAKGSIVVLTSHSVAECESVCTKMAMMVNGTLRCYGSPDHLRDLFSEGFTIIVKFILDPKKVYFTTKKDRNRVHELRSETVEEDKPPPPKHRYFDEDNARLSIDQLALFPERSCQIPLPVVEEDDEVILTTWEEDLLPFIAYFERNFPDAILVDKQPGFIHYHIRSGHSTYSALFTKMEEAKVLVAEIESYYIGMSNLDQVFINFARGQKSEG